MGLIEPLFDQDGKGLDSRSVTQLPLAGYLSFRVSRVQFCWLGSYPGEPELVASCVALVGLMELVMLLFVARIVVSTGAPLVLPGAGTSFLDGHTSLILCTGLRDLTEFSTDCCLDLLPLPLRLDDEGLVPQPSWFGPVLASASPLLLW